MYDRGDYNSSFALRAVELMIKMDNFQHFSIKSYVVDMYFNRLGDAIQIHIQNI